MMIKKFILPLMFLSLIFAACNKDSGAISNNENSGSTGAAGSLTKFTFNGNYLYVVQGRILNVYDVSDASQSVLKKRVDLENSAIETIFCNGTYLFFGTQSGMLIYGLSNPIQPNYVSTYTHVVSCDPVVVSGSLAYVTISTGNSCARGQNQLEVIDISNINQPELLISYSFANPKGLAIAGNYLYLCDNKDGFKVLDISNHMDIQVKSTLPSLIANDVIVQGNRLTISGNSGVYQYDCSDPLNIKFISKINAQ